MEIISSDVKYGTDGDDISAYLAQPEQKGKYPGIVLIHEIFGVDDHIREVSAKLASEGYVVMAPHLFSSRRLSPVLTPANIGEAMKFMMSIPMDKQRDEKYRVGEMSKLDQKTRETIMAVNQILFVERPIALFVQYLSSAIDYLNSLETVNGKIGSVGFCFGGGMSINLACTGKTDATIIFYGENPEPIEKVKNIKGAVLGFYGGEDHRINANIDKLVKALVEYNKPFAIKVYSGAYHGFFNSTRPNYNSDAASDAWKLWLDFYSKHLRSKE